MNLLTLAVAFSTLLATVYIIMLECRAARSRRRAAIVWRTLDDCMRTGYKLQDGAATIDDAWQWLQRVGRFCELALGHHAMRLIFQDGDTLNKIKLTELAGREVIQRAQTRIHRHIAGKVTDGRIHPDFTASRWEGWTPDDPAPE